MSFTDDVEHNSAEEAYNLKLQEEMERMRQYRKAVEQEFKDLKVDDPQTHKIVRGKIHELVPEACETLLNLMMHSENDAVRANLSKFVLTEAMKSAEHDKPKDAISQLFMDLAKNDAVNETEVETQ